MADQKISIVARISVREGEADTIKAELLKLADLSKSDKGCINYNLHQDKENSNLFFVYENWESYDFLQKHVKSIHFTEYMKATELATEEFVVNKMIHIA